MTTPRRMRAVYYREPSGSEPVREMVESLRPTRRRAIVENQIDRLNMCFEDDPPLPFPHTSQIRGELREVRCHFGADLYRVLYRRSPNLFILLHMLAKHTGPIPEADIRQAEQRWDDFVRRMEATPRRPPRAAGRDAPGRRRTE